MRWWWLLVVCACGRIGFDATAADSSIDSPLPSDCLAHSSAVFCEDFETDLSAWQITGNSARQTPIAHTGSGALFSAIAGWPDNAYVAHTPPPIGSPPSIYARAWVYVPGGVDLVQTDLLTLTSSAGQFFSFYIQDNLASFYIATTGTMGFSSLAPVAFDRWFCVEYDVALADAGGSFELRIDNQIVAMGANLDTLPDGSFSSFATGITFEAPIQVSPVAVYTDDVILDIAPIGCGP